MLFRLVSTKKWNCFWHLILNVWIAGSNRTWSWSQASEYLSWMNLWIKISPNPRDQKCANCMKFLNKLIHLEKEVSIWLKFPKPFKIRCHSRPQLRNPRNRMIRLNISKKMTPLLNWPRQLFELLLIALRFPGVMRKISRRFWNFKTSRLHSPQHLEWLVLHLARN